MRQQPKYAPAALCTRGVLLFLHKDNRFPGLAVKLCRRNFSGQFLAVLSNSFGDASTPEWMCLFEAVMAAEHPWMANNSNGTAQTRRIPLERQPNA